MLSGSAQAKPSQDICKFSGRGQRFSQCKRELSLSQSQMVRVGGKKKHSSFSIIIIFRGATEKMAQWRCSGISLHYGVSHTEVTLWERETFR